MSLVIPHIPDLKLSKKDTANPYIIKNLIEVSKEVIYSNYDTNMAIIYINSKVRLTRPLSESQFEKIKEYVTSGNYHKYRLAENLESGMIESHMINIDTIKKCIQIARKTLLMKEMANDIKGHNLSVYDVHATSKILEVTNSLVSNMNTIQQYTPSLMKLQMAVDEHRGNIITNGHNNGNGHNGNGKSNIERSTNNKDLGNGNGHTETNSTGQIHDRSDNIKHDSKQKESVHDRTQSIRNAGINESQNERQEQGSDTSGISSGEREEIYIRDRFGEETGIIKSPQNDNFESSNSVTKGEPSKQNQNLNGGIGKPTNRVF